MSANGNKTELKTKVMEIADTNSIISDLQIVTPSNIVQAAKNEEVDASMLKQADDVVTKLFATDPSEFKIAEANRNAVETMGMAIQKRAAEESAMLKAPIGEMSKRSDEGSEVSNALVDLKMQVEDLDPASIDFKPGFVSRILGKLPFIGSPLKRYFTKFESAQTVLAAIENSLLKGQEQLKRDNTTLQADQIRMRDLTKELEKAIQLGQLIDQRLDTRLEREIETTDSRYKFIQEEILHPLRVRIQDLQQQLIVNQQGVLTSEVIIRNNKELIRGVTRSLNVTMNALTTAVVLAEALNHQRITLTKLKGLNDTTNALIAGTARMLKEQTPEISKLASEASIDMDTLKVAFQDIKTALDEISTFKQRALPQMANNILEMDKMIEGQEDVIKRMEEGNVVSGGFIIDVV